MALTIITYYLLAHFEKLGCLTAELRDSNPKNLEWSKLEQSYHYGII